MRVSSFETRKSLVESLSFAVRASHSEPFWTTWKAARRLISFLIDFPGVSRDTAIAALEEAKALLIARFVT